MQVVPLVSKSEEKEFIEFPVELYRDNPTWIRPMDGDIQAVFDQEKNKAFTHGKCSRWLLKNEGKTVGRIAAFITYPSNPESGNKTSAGIGFLSV